jgi:hypothetical protein
MNRPEVVLWEHRCSDGIGGCTAISATYLKAVLAFLEQTAKTKAWKDEAGLLVRWAQEDGYTAAEETDLTGGNADPTGKSWSPDFGREKA